MLEALKERLEDVKERVDAASGYGDALSVLLDSLMGLAETANNLDLTWKEQNMLYFATLSYGHYDLEVCNTSGIWFWRIHKYERRAGKRRKSSGKIINYGLATSEENAKTMATNELELELMKSNNVSTT